MTSLIKIVVGIVFLFAGWKILEKSDSLTTKEELQRVKTFCDNSATTTGFLRDSFNEIKVRIGKIDTKMYQFTYDYFVGSEQFTATSTSNLKTSKSSVTIWVDKNNPADFSMSDPCQLFQSIKNKKTGNRTYFYMMGGLILLTGIALVWGTFKRLLRNLITSGRG